MKRNKFLSKYGYNKVFSKKEIDQFYGYNASTIIKDLLKLNIIKKISKGLYYIMSYGEGYIMEHPFFFLKYIGSGNNIPSHGCALSYYGLLEQFFNLNIISTKDNYSKSKITMGDYNYYRTPDLFPENFGIKTIYIDNRPYKITNLERTFLDSFSNPKLAGGIKEVAKAFYEAVDEDLINFKEMGDYLSYYKNKHKIAKSIGFFIDIFNIKKYINIDFYNLLLEYSQTKGYYPLDSSIHDINSKIKIKKWKLYISKHENFNSIIKY